MLIRNTTWALKGNMAYAVSQWALLIILAKFGGSESVGRYTLGLAITAPIFLLTGLQLRSLIATDVLETHQFSNYIRLRLLTSIIAIVTICFVVSRFSYTSAQVVVILLVGLAKILESGSDIFYGIMQKHERMDLISFSKIVRGVATVLAFGTTFYVTRSLAAALISTVLIWLLVLVLIDYRNARRIGSHSFDRMCEVLSKDSWSRATLLALMWHAFPLGIVSMLMSFNNAVPRYFLESYHGENALGYFAAIAYFSSVITIIVEAFGQAALPRLAKYYEGQPLQYWRLLCRLAAVALVLGTLGIGASFVIGPYFLSVLYRPEFSLHGGLLVLIMVLGTFEALCSVFGVGLTAARVLTFQVPVLLIVLAVTTSAGWRFIPEYGLIGTAWASILGTVVWAVIFGLIMVGLERRRARQLITA